MKRSFWLALAAMVAFSQPAWAQQDDVARLSAELQRSRRSSASCSSGSTISRRSRRRRPRTKSSRRKRRRSRTRSNSVREIAARPRQPQRLFQFPASPPTSRRTPIAFQQHHLGLILGKQLRPIQLPHGARAPERAAPPRDTVRKKRARREEGEHVEEHRHQRRGPGGGRERVDGIQSQPVPERSRRQAALAAVLVAESLSEPDLLDRPADLPARAVSAGAGRRDGARQRGEAVGAVGVRRRLHGLPRRTTSSKATARPTCATARRGAAACRCGCRPAAG